MQSTNKKRVYLVVTEAFDKRDRADYGKLDLRLPGEVLGVREIAQQAFDLAQQLSHTYGTVGVKLALITENQVLEFNRREQAIIEKAVNAKTVTDSQRGKSLQTMLDEYLWANQPRDTQRTPPPALDDPFEIIEADIE
jgi:hypothetical protein